MEIYDGQEVDFIPPASSGGGGGEEKQIVIKKSSDFMFIFLENIWM